MSMERYIRAIAGLFILASLALGWFVTPWALLFTAFVGANLLQSAFTGVCPMESILEHLGVARRAQAPKRA
jgi:Protein of unknown function (DUF2892)